MDRQQKAKNTLLEMLKFGKTFDFSNLHPPARNYPVFTYQQASLFEGMHGVVGKFGIGYPNAHCVYRSTDGKTATFQYHV